MANHSLARDTRKLSTDTIATARLRWADGWTYREIANALGVSIEALKVYRRRESWPNEAHDVARAARIAARRKAAAESRSLARAAREAERQREDEIIAARARPKAQLLDNAEPCVKGHVERSARNGQCLACKRARQRASRLAHPDVIRERNRAWKARNRLWVRVNDRRRRSRKEPPA